MALNPYYTNIFIDSCAFDPKYEPENRCSEEIFQMYEREEISIVISHSILKETEHPNTPEHVKAEAASKIFSINVCLTQAEENKKHEICSILTGNGKPDKMKQDANHVFEAHKHVGYFVTTDNRIIKMRTELHKVCNAIIVKPSELIKLLNEHSNS